MQIDFDKRYQVFSYPSPQLWHYLYLETSSNQTLGSVFELPSYLFDIFTEHAPNANLI